MKPSRKDLENSIKKDTKIPTGLDIFCGCGGLTVGLKRAGFRVLAAVDNDPIAIETYKANHPETRVLTADIRTIDPAKFAAESGLTGRLDLLAGCPPCQGFSTMRTLNGALPVDDPRNDLLFEFLRFVEDLLPRTIMLENVPGLAVDPRFTHFLKRMNELGYVGNHRVLDAADYGVPQRRRRLIYLAGMGAEIPFAEPARKRKTVGEVIRSLPAPGSSGDPVHDMPENRSPRVREMIRMIPKNGGGRSDLPEEYRLGCHRRCDGFKDVYGRMRWGDVAPTITSGCFNPSKGRFLHPEADRAITMREAALLQSFPRRYLFTPTGGKVAVALMIGNALPPEFVRRHALKIKKYLASPAGI